MSGFVNFYMQVAVVANNRSMNKLPKVEGLLSYRSDDRKLYLKEKSQWQALANRKDVSYTVHIAVQNLNQSAYLICEIY